MYKPSSHLFHCKGNTLKPTDDTGIAALYAFEAEAARHRRMLTTLFCAFALYYFGLLIMAAYFQPLCAIRVIGRVNVGMLLAVSQYLFGGIVAWIYVVRMRATDDVMHSLPL